MVASTENFYGTSLVTDGYCKNPEKYISMFTPDINRKHIQGTCDEVMQQLWNLNDTGILSI